MFKQFYYVDFWINGVHRQWIRFAKDVQSCHESAKQAIYEEYNKVVGINATLSCTPVNTLGIKNETNET
jgi:hypothetical protein